MKFATGILAAAVVLLSGCVTPPQTPIPADDSKFNASAGRIGVVMTELPKVDTQFPGAGCLLCMAAASATNSSLTSHTQTLPVEDLPQLKNEVADLLRKKGANVTVIAENLKLDTLPEFATKGPNIASKDHSPLKKRYDVDKLVVLNVTGLGVERGYSAYVPTGPPNGLFQGEGYLVNLSNNTYEWFHRVRVLRSADGGNWDEPPKFPGITNAYFQALEIGKDEFKKPLGQ